MPRVAARAAARLRSSRRSRGGRLSLLGAAFIAVFAAVVLFGFTKPNPFDSPQTVTAVFDETASLGKILRTVRLEGVNVGSIGDVRRVGDDAEVELLLDEDVGTIHEDARAEIRPHILFEGTVFIELYPGSEASPPLGDGVIPLSQTQVFLPFDVALRALDERTRRAFQGLSSDLASGLGGGATRGLQKTLRAAPALLSDLEPAARAAQGPHRDELTGAIRGMSTTLAALAPEERRIGPLVRDSRRTFEALGTDFAAPLEQTLRGLPPALVEVDRGSRTLETVLDELDPLAADLEPALVELTPFLRESRPLLADAEPVLRGATPLLADLRVALDETADAAPPTRGLLRALAPGAELLTRSSLPYLHRDTGLGVPNYIQLGSFITGFPGVLGSYQTGAQNEYGSGHFGRIEGNFLAGIDGVFTPGPCDGAEGLAPELVQTLVESGVCAP